MEGYLTLRFLENQGFLTSFSRESIKSFLNLSTRCFCPKVKGEQWHPQQTSFSWRRWMSLKLSVSLDSCLSICIRS
ncbi:hypothetical protein MTR67_025856 [Solanum verrucosum]|uniref:Uncharacterized protein n=1 Tax=Solanum verrucosum TaxID=315347 RepID=A0AAF0R5X2_SOLVR|nr:hypothetical protein MTR67_025856 [Solanum verrucosum]